MSQLKKSSLLVILFLTIGAIINVSYADLAIVSESTINFFVIVLFIIAIVVFLIIAVAIISSIRRNKVRDKIDKED